MDNARKTGSAIDSFFLFTILFISPLFVIQALGGSAQFGTAWQALAALGKARDARDALNTALELDPGNETVRRMLNRPRSPSR